MSSTNNIKLEHKIFTLPHINCSCAFWEAEHTYRHKIPFFFFARKYSNISRLQPKNHPDKHLVLNWHWCHKISEIFKWIICLLINAGLLLVSIYVLHGPQQLDLMYVPWLLLSSIYQQVYFTKIIFLAVFLLLHLNSPFTVLSLTSTQCHKKSSIGFRVELKMIFFYFIEIIMFQYF